MNKSASLEIILLGYGLNVEEVTAFIAKLTNRYGAAKAERMIRRGY